MRNQRWIAITIVSTGFEVDVEKGNESGVAAVFEAVMNTAELLTSI